MQSSADMEMKTEKRSLTPGEVLPALELLADLLSELDKPEEALEAYELNLEIRPNRFNSIYGAALSAKNIGNNEKAKMYFESLMNITKGSDGDRLEINEAHKYIDQI